MGPFSGILGKVLPVVGVISLIVAAVQILRDNLDKVREVVGRVFGDAGLVIFDKVVAAITNIGDTIRNVFTDGNLGGARQFLINLFGEEATGVIDGAITILQTVWNILSGFIEFVNTYVRPIVEQIFSFIVGTVLPQIAQAFAEWAPTIASILQGLAEVVSTIATAIMAVIQFLMPTIQSIIGVALETIKGVVSGALTAIKGLVDVFAGIFTGDWTRVWEGVKSIFSGVWNSLKSIASGVLNGIISLVNGAISGLNKLKIPDWVPGIGGKGINIPLIPQFATGTDSTPDTFIAGEQGAELITNAKNRSVFTAARTGSIFRNLADTVNAIRTAGAAPYQLAYAGAPSVAAPTLNAGDGRTSVVIHSAPVFHVGNDARHRTLKKCYAATTKSCWTKSTSGSGKDRTTKGGGTMTKYTTIAGDMWDGIAYKTLGDEVYTDRLMKLNPQYRRTFVFPAGITLTVPEPETRVSSDLPPWKRGTAE